MRSVRRTAAVLSSAAAILCGGMSAVAAGAASAPLTGSGHGTWQQKPTNPDVGTTRVVHGHGHFSIGDATIRGTVSAPGFVIAGSCNVKAVLTTATGSVTIVGHSKVESRSDGSICDGHKFRFHFHTTKATGDLAGDSLAGVGRFVLTDASNAAYDHGTFTLTLGAVR